jgi:hypothetical protein
MANLKTNAVNISVEPPYVFNVFHPLVVRVPRLERDRVLLRVVLHLVSPLPCEDVDNVERVECGPLEDEALVVLVQLAGEVNVLVALVDRLHVSLVQTWK